MILRLAPLRPLRRGVLFPLVLALCACRPLPDLGTPPVPVAPPPPLLPLDQVLSAPLPTATADSAAALMARGDSIRAEAQSIAASDP